MVDELTLLNNKLREKEKTILDLQKELLELYKENAKFREIIQKQREEAGNAIATVRRLNWLLAEAEEGQSDEV